MEEWKASRHALAFTNRHFQVALQDSPYRWCAHCHSPLPEQFEEIRSWLRDAPHHLSLPPSARRSHPPALVGGKKGKPGLYQEGINCAVCHLRDGVILAAKPPTPKALKEHPIRHDPRLKEAHFCAGCHQFNFPAALTTPQILTETPAQDTYREWEGSWAKAQGKTCISCHMHQGSHVFPGAHDPERLKRSLQIQVTLRDPSTVEVIVRSRRVGHAIPTGDPFRRLIVSVFAKDGDPRVLATFTFQRIFRIRDQRWYVWKDERIPAPTTSAVGEKRITLRLPTPQTSISWEFSYYYAEFQHHTRLKPSEIRLRIARGHSTSRTRTRGKR